MSPPAIIRNAPTKKGFSNGWSSSSSSAFSASQESCDAREERCGKPNKHIRRLHEGQSAGGSSTWSGGKGVELFKNPMVKENIMKKRLFEEGFQAPNNDEGAPAHFSGIPESARRDTESDHSEQEVQDDTLIDFSEPEVFMQALRNELGCENRCYRIFPTAKQDNAMFERLALSIYNQVPPLMMRHDQGPALEYFDFDCQNDGDEG